MPARENAFHVEKHANDALHNPPRGGVTHTDREIRAASAALGRNDGNGARRRAATARSLELRRGDVVVRDGAVVRVDAEGAVESGGVGGRVAGRARGDAGERWRTMDRIAAGGTAGGAALREARRAALGLVGRRRDDACEDDGPVVVPASDLRFVDGWATSGTPELEQLEKEATREIGAAKSERFHSTATIGRKPKRARATRVARDETPRSGVLSFDANA